MRTATGGVNIHIMSGAPGKSDEFTVTKLGTALRQALHRSSCQRLTAPSSTLLSQKACHCPILSSVYLDFHGGWLLRDLYF